MGNTGGLQQLLEKLKKGALDLVLDYDYDENEFEGIPLHNERLIFVIHKDTQGAAVLKKCSVNPNCRKFCCGSACSLLPRKIKNPQPLRFLTKQRLGVFLLARLKEFESPTCRLGGDRSILLSYGRIRCAEMRSRCIIASFDPIGKAARSFSFYSKKTIAATCLITSLGWPAHSWNNCHPR